MSQSGASNLAIERYANQSRSYYDQHITMFVLFYPAAIILNILLVVIILVKKDLREDHSRWPLVHTSLVAVAFLLNAYVFDIQQFRVDVPWLKSASCHVTTYIDGVLSHVLKFSIVLVSVDRVWAIWRPYDFPKGLSKSVITAALVILWAAIILIYTPLFFRAYEKSPSPHITIVCSTAVNLKHAAIYYVWPYIPIFVVILSDIIAMIYYMCSHNDYIDAIAIKNIAMPTIIMDVFFVGLYFPFMVMLFIFATGNFGVGMPTTLFHHFVILYWSVFPVTWLISRDISREFTNCCKSGEKKGEAAKLISVENVQEFQYVERPPQITVKLPQPAGNLQ